MYVIEYWNKDLGRWSFHYLEASDKTPEEALEFARKNDPKLTLRVKVYAPTQIHE